MGSALARDSEVGIGRCNRAIDKAGLPHRLKLPRKAFNRRIGLLAEVRATSDGHVVSEADWNARASDWLPSDDDHARSADGL